MRICSPSNAKNAATRGERIGKISDAGREFHSVSHHASYVGIRISPTERISGERFLWCGWNPVSFEKIGGFRGARIWIGRLVNFENGAVDRRFYRWGTRRKAQAIQNLPRRLGRMNGGENSKPAVAVGTFQNVKFENAPHQLRPGIIPPPPVNSSMKKREKAGSMSGHSTSL